MRSMPKRYRGNGNALFFSSKIDCRKISINCKLLYSVINIINLKIQNLFPFLFLLLKIFQIINMYFDDLFRRRPRTM